LRNPEPERHRLHWGELHPLGTGPLLVIYQLAIFDFDGTLADSWPFFVSVYNELAAKYDLRRVAEAEVPTLRRMGAREVMRHVGVPASKLPRIAADFVARMRAHRQAVPPFAGAPELLIDLHRQGIALGIVSSNAHDNITAILGRDAAAAVRYYACGMSIFGKRSHLRKVLRQSGMDTRAAVYIGDQPTDLEAAHAAGLAFGAVAWGYGDIERLQALGAKHAFRDMAEIAALLRPAHGAR
jgi:phosphoglycolate phosphatase